MNLFDPKTNKFYSSLNELPLEKKKKNASKSKTIGSFSDYDMQYEFFHQGKHLKARDIKTLQQSNPKPQIMIIVRQKSFQPYREVNHVSYDTHREVIQRYIRQTKENETFKIEQNAQFIFERAIDANFKYHSFEYFQLEHEFTEERKKELLEKVFVRICQENGQDINVIDWSENDGGFGSKDKKEVKTESQSKKALNEIEEKEQEHDEESNVHQSDQQNRAHTNKPILKAYSIEQSKQKLHLQLHQLQYITQNWKQLLCINKYLLKTNLDNPRYYDQLQKQKIMNENNTISNQKPENSFSREDKQRQNEHEI